MEFVTIAKSDPQFKSYLSGNFASNRRALPIETYHPSTDRERVTFQLVPIHEVKSPAWWRVFLLSTRPELLALTMGPAMVTWLLQKELIQNWSRWPSWLALVGLFFLHTAVFIFNDVQDHMSGGDRANRRRGSQVIQRGWVTASSMQKWGFLNLALAVLFGIPAFLNAPRELTAVAGFTIVALGLLWWSRATKWGASDFAVTLLFGPLLAAGISLASFSVVNLKALIVGTVLGSMTTWTLQVRQLENLFRSRPEEFHTLIGYWSFDRVRSVILAEGAALVLIQPALALWLGAPSSSLVLLPIACWPMFRVMESVYRANSPLSSTLTEVSGRVLWAHVAWLGWWIVLLGVSWL